jgi:hypothetical protein
VQGHPGSIDDAVSTGELGGRCSSARGEWIVEGIQCERSGFERNYLNLSIYIDVICIFDGAASQTVPI